MLQRIQTLYLLIVLISQTLYASPVPYVAEQQQIRKIITDIGIGDNRTKAIDILAFSLFMFSGVLALASIFMFKNRKSQFVLGRLNIILNFFLLGFFVYRSLNLSGETLVSEKGIGMFLPVLSIVFLVLANKAIKKDEDLVKSVDRLR